MSAEQALFYTLGACLTVYCLTGGADYGAGVWDLLARGPDKGRDRLLIQRALGPIWEANHIWMIVAVVLLFSGFPEAFATIAIALHVPISLALVGIILRGSAFVFSAYGLRPAGYRGVWARLFGWASALTPLALGMTLAGLSSGSVQLESGRVVSGYWQGWNSAFGWLLGTFAMALFALLAACYLAIEATRSEPSLAEGFRRRGLWCEGLTGCLAALVAWRASIEAPLLFDNLLRSGWSLLVQAATAVAAGCTLLALHRRHYRLAACAAGLQVALVVAGFGLSMDEHLVLPAMPLAHAGAIAEVVQPVLWVLAGGAVVLLPALAWLFLVFKGDLTSKASRSR